MHVMHDNFGSLPANARELSLVVRNDEELNNLLVACCQTSIKSYFHRSKKNRGGSRNPATTKTEVYVIFF